ncbi:hypothetical protein AAC387_Pa08g1999 [Persea americana]
MRKGGYTGMRCKLHPLEPGTVGVCASCLRERLLDLLAAQARDAGSGDDRRKSDPPLIFPRSVSPYINRRSVHNQHHLLIYSTPQVGPTFSGDGNVKKKHGRFSLFRSLFRSSARSGEMDGDHRVFGARNESLPSNSSPSWFSTLLPRSRKKKSRLFSLDDEFSGAGCRRSCPAVDRGMSPSAERKGYGDGDESPIGSGYSSESSTGRRNPATATPAQRKRGGGAQHSRNVSGFAFCLSPLVSHHHRPESGPSGEFRGANRHHWSSAASLSSNRSRKLVDFGRYP